MLAFSLGLRSMRGISACIQEVATEYIKKDNDDTVRTLDLYQSRSA
jgi:hypothetical protein